METKHQHILNFQCHDKNGNLLWEDEIRNKAVKEGLDEILNKFYGGENYTADLEVGLTGTTPVFDADDTLSSHSGWTEFTAYDNIVGRATLTVGTASNQSIDNADNLAVFVIDTNGSVIGGAFICTAGGILIGGGALSNGDETVNEDSVLSITVTATAASAS